MSEEKPRVLILSKEQIAYAYWLHFTSRIGMLLLVLAAVVYFAGILPQDIPLDQLCDYWHLSLRDYQSVILDRDSTQSPRSWISRIDRGEYFARLPVAFLGLVTICCYIRIAPVLLKKRDYIYFGIVCIEVVLLLLSVSGIMNT